MNGAAELIAQAQAALAAGGLVFLRVAAAAALLPAFGERVVPVRVRLVGALALTLLVAPLVAAALPRDGAAWGWLLLTETVAGLALGAALRLMVMALQMAGSMAAQATSLAQVFGGQAADPMPAIGHVMTFGGLALLAAAGWHVKMVAFVALSYELMPPGQLPDPADLLRWGVGRVAQAFALAFALAAPFVLASVVYNVALGVINRAMPQLMVAFVGAPAITAGALGLLALCLPLILSIWLQAVEALLLDPTGGP